MTAVAIVCPGYPEQAGGVNDHTGRLRRHWTDEGAVVFVQGSTGEDPESIAERWRSAGVIGLLIQYVPFLYARRGLSRFPAALARAARREGLRVTLFVHEPWVPPTRLPWLVLSPLQRRQLRRLAQLADVVVTALPAWQALLGGDTRLVYVGSTLGDIPAPPADAARLEAPVVFSPFAAGLAWEWIAAAVEALNAGLVIVGADADTMRAHAVTRRWYRESWDCRGQLAAEEALASLAQARVGLAPYVDGATGRRTSLLALMSAGVPVVTSEGHLFDPLFGSGPHPAAATKDAFVALTQDAWGTATAPGGRARRLAWYREHFDPLTLDRRLLNLVAGGLT